MDVEESPWADTSQGASQRSQDEPSTSQSTTASQSQSQSAGASSSTATPASPRTARAPRRLIAQPTRLQAVEDPLGPLGGASGDEATAQDAPPAPPQKEQMVLRTTMVPQQQQPRRPADPHRIDDDDFDEPRGPRQPPPVEAARPSSVRSSTNPSVSVEQAAKPSFHITVGDPVKIGDLTSSHIVYSVRTKVSSALNPSAPLHLS